MSTPPRLGQPALGYGVGLRRTHWDEILDHHPGVDFFEILTENFLGRGGRAKDALRRACEAGPIVLHGTSLDIGGPDPLDADYLEGVGEMIRACKPLWWSDHICFSRGYGVQYHDLLPLPFTEEAVAHVVERTRQVQAVADIPFLLENPSYYVEYEGSDMSEAEFVREIVERADCGLLLDVNNVFVNAENHGYDARAFIDALPLERVVQLHMAGHHQLDDVIIDTHGNHVVDPVFDLLAYVLERTGPLTVLLEWDNQIPTVEVLLAENDKVRAVGEAVVGPIPKRGAA
jgi:uncharacterized protein (UPF0276 family)